MKVKHVGCNADYRYRTITLERGFQTKGDYFAWLYKEYLRLNEKWSKYLKREVAINTVCGLHNRENSGFFGRNELSPWKENK